MPRINSKKGFSLLELLVATFVFLVVIVASTVIFGNSIRGYRSAKVIQKDLENAQDAMNIMAKTLRTSSVQECFSAGAGGSDCSIVADPINTIRVFDYSQNKCFMYFFNTTESRLEQREKNPPDINNPDCTGGGYASSSGIILVDTGNVTGRFDVVQSSAGQVGKVTISMEVAPDPSTVEKDKARTQTTVSLRDYDESEVEGL